VRKPETGFSHTLSPWFDFFTASERRLAVGHHVYRHLIAIRLAAAEGPQEAGRFAVCQKHGAGGKRVDLLPADRYARLFQDVGRELERTNNRFGKMVVQYLMTAFDQPVGGTSTPDRCRIGFLSIGDLSVHLHDKNVNIHG